MAKPSTARPDSGSNKAEVKKVEFYHLSTQNQKEILMHALSFQTTTEAPKVKIHSSPKTTKRPAVQPTKPSNKQQPPAQHKETPGSNQNECSGDCVNGLIALFCDDVDSDAFCPNEGSCCITTDEKLQTTTPRITTPVSQRLDPITTERFLWSMSCLLFSGPTTSLSRILSFEHYGCIL